MTTIKDIKINHKVLREFMEGNSLKLTISIKEGFYYFCFIGKNKSYGSNRIEAKSINKALKKWLEYISGKDTYFFGGIFPNFIKD